MNAPAQARASDRTTAAGVRAARNVAATGAVQVISKFTTLVWTVLAARYLTTEQFGLFNLALTTALLLSVAAEWGFDQVLVQRGSRDPSTLSVRYTLTVAWESVVGLPVFAVAALVAAALRPTAEARWTIVLVFAAVFVDLWSDSGRAAGAAAQRQVGTSTALFVQRVTTLAFAAPALWLGLGLVGLAASFLAGYVAGFVATHVALARLGIRLVPREVTRSAMSRFASGTFFVGISAFVLMALYRLDAIFLSILKGDAAVAAYSSAYRLFETSLFVTFSVTAVTFPLLSRAIGDARRFGTLLGNALVAIAIVYLPFAAVLLVDAHALLAVVYGRSYADSATVALRWLAPAPLFYAASYLLYAALLAGDRVRRSFVAAVAALAVNVVLNLALIPHFSASGAAAANTIAYAVATFAAVGGLRGIASRPAVRALGVPLVATAAVVAFLLISPLPVLVEVVAAAGIYLALWVVLARRFAPEQVALVRSAVSGRGRKDDETIAAVPGATRAEDDA